MNTQFITRLLQATFFFSVLLFTGATLSAQTLQHHATLNCGKNGGYFNGIDHSADGKWIASCNNIEVVIWNAATNQKHLALPNPAPNTYSGSVSFSPDSKLLAVGYTDGITLYSPETGAVVSKIKTAGDVSALVFSPDGTRIAGVAGGEGGDYRIFGDNVWEVSSGTRLLQLGKAFSSEKLTSELAFSPDGKWIACAVGNKGKGIALYDAVTGKQLSFTKYKADATCLAFSADSKRLITGSIDRKIRFHELPGGKLIKEFQAHAGYDDRGYVCDLDLSADGKFLVSVSDDIDKDGNGTEPNLRLWNAETGAAISATQGDVKYAFKVSVAPDGKSCTVGGRQRDLEVISIGSVRTGASQAVEARPAWKVGDRVEIKDAGSWYKATLLKVDGEKYFIHYDGYDAEHDAWVHPSRVRAIQ